MSDLKSGRPPPIMESFRPTGRRSGTAVNQRPHPAAAVPAANGRQGPGAEGPEAGGAARRTDNPTEETAVSEKIPGSGPIEERVLELIKKEMEGKGTNPITRETDFVNDLGLDSLDTVELMMLLEDKFSVHIPDEDAIKIKTVGDAVDYIVKHQPK